MSLALAIQTASAGEEVPASQLEAAFGEIMDGKASPVAIAALLVALRTKGETPGEIVAAARALRARAVTAEVVDANTVDTCGTGGDGSGTFNISTTAAFVVAGAGVPVAKHGNRAASSRAGSFDVLEALGVDIELPLAACADVLAEVGIAPFFARSAHPAMRHVAPVRQELGIRTLMNCLGPLLNPVGARRQLVGVYDDALVIPMARALGELGAERALVVHGNDGLDEITTTGPTHAAWISQGESGAADGFGSFGELEIDPKAFGIAPASADALAGGDANENADILRAILRGELGPRRDIVLLNAAAALWVSGGTASGAAVADVEAGLVAALLRAVESIDSGAADAKLDALIAATRRARAGL